VRLEQTPFFGVTLEVERGTVMAPRPASEALVATAARRIRQDAARVADVGTGSGAIAVALAVSAPHAEIWASDTNPQAVLLARTNAHRLGVGDRVRVVQGDLLAPIPGELDLVVANLPYLPRGARERYADLHDEPDDAVFAAGDGLGPYRRLLAAAHDKLVPGGAAVIQLHRRVLVAERERLSDLEGMLRAA
jgi:release factor glutamine methyltransferase